MTEEEAKNYYLLDNNKIDFRYLQIPYELIADSLISISDEEIKKYIEKNKEKYETEASRGARFIYFSEEASKEDEENIRKYLTDLLSKRIEYNDISKLNDTIESFKKVANISDFVNQYSEEIFDSIYVPKSSLSKEYADILFNLNKNEIFGPYKDLGYYKLSRMVDKKNKGAIRSSHIFISYKRDSLTPPSITRTKDEAEEIANEVFKELKREPRNFEKFAFQVSDDRVSAENGGDLGFIQENEIIPDFFNYINRNKKGRLGLLETERGFHIIKITDKQDVVLIADIKP